MAKPDPGAKAQAVAASTSLKDAKPIPLSDDNLKCGMCAPGVVPGTSAAQRALQRYRWCAKCSCARAFYPAAMEQVNAGKKPKDDGNRPCRWPGCGKRVAPRLWGCRAHWYALPANLRNAILAAYQPGQEDDLTLVGADWVEADRQAREWAGAQAKA